MLVRFLFRRHHCQKQEGEERDRRKQQADGQNARQTDVVKPLDRESDGRPCTGDPDSKQNQPPNRCDRVIFRRRDDLRDDRRLDKDHQKRGKRKAQHSGQRT